MATPATKPPANAPTRGRRSPRMSGDEREQAIRQTLESLLDQRSFFDISIDDLARGAGISRSTFYFYYESKEAVLMTLADEIVSEADTLAEAARAALEQDTERFLHDALAAYVTTFGQHRGVIVACRQAAAANAEVQRLWNVVRERWVEMAAGAINAERRRVGLEGTLSARELAIALLSMNEAVMVQMFSGRDPAIDESRVTDVLTNIWINAAYEGTRKAQSPRSAQRSAP